MRCGMCMQRYVVTYICSPAQITPPMPVRLLLPKGQPRKHRHEVWYVQDDMCCKLYALPMRTHPPAKGHTDNLKNYSGISISMTFSGKKLFTYIFIFHINISLEGEWQAPKKVFFLERNNSVLGVLKGCLCKVRKKVTKVNNVFFEVKYVFLEV